MTGRPVQYVGVRSCDLRLKFSSYSGHTRGFYARWRPQLRKWECQLSGYGMQPRRWLSTSQTMALANLRFVACLWSWKQAAVDPSLRWDDITDTGFEIDSRTGQLDMFEVQRQIAAAAGRVAA